jgi:hypothetical protein
MNLHIAIAQEVVQLVALAVSEYEILRFVLGVNDMPGVILQIVSYFLT